MKLSFEHVTILFWAAVSAVSAVAAGLLVHYLIFFVISRLAQRTQTPVYPSLTEHCRKPSRVIFPLIAFYFVLPLLEITPRVDFLAENVFRTILIVSVAWLVVTFTSVLEDVVLGRFRMDAKDNLAARKVYTQFRIIKKVMVVLVVVLTVAAVLMTSERFRQLGTGILASAGVTGLIVGLAARSTLTNLIAGIQIAVTQPLRLDDVLIVENEWGRVEEITLTYVVLRIWDLRRLIIPINYFIEKPFQNWTRVSANLIGSVYLYMDYTVPVRELRDELQNILQGSMLWDGQTAGLQVTDATERTIQVRVIVGAPDSGSAWNLRCQVREKLIEFVQKKYPDALPKLRAEVREAATDAPRPS
jgi:small-conductance mechanosensitive channel